MIAEVLPKPFDYSGYALHEMNISFIDGSFPLDMQWIGLAGGICEINLLNFINPLLPPDLDNLNHNDPDNPEP